MNMAKLKAVIFPLLTALFLALAWFTGGENLKTALLGRRTAGRVVALLRCNDERCDLLIDPMQVLTLRQADGGEITAITDRDGIRSLQHRLREDVRIWSAAEVAAARQNGGDEPLKRLTAAADAVRNGRSDGMQRFLQREARKAEEDRVVSVLREETFRVLRQVDAAAGSYEVQDGRIAAVAGPDGRRNADDADRVVTRIECTYIGGTGEAKTLKTDVTRVFTRTVNGVPEAAAKEDFLTYTGDPRCVFRPVFAYQAAETVHAVAADIGARESPRSNHQIGEPLLVAYRPETPGQATMLSDFGMLKGRGPLDALNLFFELTFGRWFIPAVSLLVALAYLFMSVITVSLVIKPPRTENADTVDEEALKRMNRRGPRGG